MSCLMAGAVALALSGPGFTLHWTHSVEKTEWVEAWELRPHSLYLLEARIKGSGAGMEPGEGAVQENGWWVWSPGTEVAELHLAASGSTGAGWRLCDGGTCHDVGRTAGRAIRLAPCDSP
ncbi:DUF1850 domain-containing protein [Pseudotabrizicola algicola]|uniref:DUF1850 domain-containing protein n=1 Tax=Pseudotabrizicola algicola TaxID=2709381 RepID=A0A6B3RTK8_9RHOB|nr:DUF1850 domain-containing protein [Pseudotabrizicola algicola]NEX47285.1 DUF1850 domain-containing protein [Pseudotabrizicola algicola]